MNIFSIAHAAVSAVNSLVTVSIRASTGYTTNPDGKRVPAYADPVSVKARIEPMQYNDIVMADSLNIQGVRSKIYIFGEIDGVVRAKSKGGDLITLPDNTVWKIAVISEDWTQWTCAIITMQNGA